MDGKFIVNQKELLSILSSMQPICNKKSTLDITETILFQVGAKELILKTTDLEISLQSSMTIESNLVDNIEFLISGKRIFDVVRELEDKIEFFIHDNQLNLKSGSVDLALNIKDKQEFPLFPERIENLMNLEASFLLELLEKVAFLIPQNNSNVSLNGMLLEFNNHEMALVTTDGHRLAKVKTDKFKLGEDRKWLLPRRAVLELKKLLEISTTDNIFLGICGNQLVFSGNSFNFFTKLITDSFPQYEPVMQKDGFLPATIDKEAFLKTLKRTGCLLSGNFVSTTFNFKPNTLDVKLHNKEVGKLEEVLVLEGFTGQDIESKYYSPYLLNGLQVFPGQKINMYIQNNIRPLIFESEEKDYKFTYVVMPVSAEEL